MAQLTIRSSEELVERVRRAAAQSKRSMNAWVTLVLDAATNPDNEADEVERVRAKLRAAGLLADEAPMPMVGPSIAELHRMAGDSGRRGVPASDLVSLDRGE